MQLRARSLLCLVIAFVPLLGGGVSRGGEPAVDDRPIVHEWGTFTTVAGEDGVPIVWRPLDTPSDLPSFVYVGLPKGDAEATVRMETPVLYFYTDRDTTASVRVAFPAGRITEWYPAARFGGSTLAWRAVQILPGASARFPVEGRPSHYYPARETDAATLRVGPQHERFLFYRGIGSFELPLSVRLEGGTVVVRNDSPHEIAQVVLFENRAGSAGYAVHDLVRGEAVLDRPFLGQDLSALYRDLETLLVAHGLYEKEARAMIETWRESWFEDGLRVFYVVPRALTDAVLPVAIEPRPAELVRVLVGRAEVLTPERESAILEEALRLEETAPAAQRLAAMRRLGRFADPALRHVLRKSEDPELRARLRRLVQGR